MIYHFAYGSNLKLEQMKKRCPESRKVGSSVLYGYKLLFRKHDNCSDGRLTIEKEKDKTIPIGIFEMPENNKISLDSREGVHNNCYKVEWLECDFNGSTIKGFAYIMENPKKAKPTQEYIDKAKRGYKDFGFDECYLEEALKECEE